jgi:hypothetical protein
MSDSWLPLYWHLDKDTLIQMFNSALCQEDLGGSDCIYPCIVNFGIKER